MTVKEVHVRTGGGGASLAWMEAMLGRLVYEGKVCLWGTEACRLYSTVGTVNVSPPVDRVAALTPKVLAAFEAAGTHGHNVLELSAKLVEAGDTKSLADVKTVLQNLRAAGRLKYAYQKFILMPPGETAEPESALQFAPGVKERLASFDFENPDMTITGVELAYVWASTTGRGFTLDWQSKSGGFGKLGFQYHDGKLVCANEGMGPEFIATVFAALGASAEMRD